MNIPKSLIATCLGVWIILSMPKMAAAVTDYLSLDSGTVARCMLQMAREPNGLLVFRFVDSETQAELDSVDVLMKFGGDKYSRPIRDWQATWRRPGYHSIKILLDGYVSVIADRIRVPTDSATVVTIQMERGTGATRAGTSHDGPLHAVIKSLDRVFPRNEISGKVLEGTDSYPIPGAAVYCEETDQLLSSDSLGEFVLPLNLLKSVTLNVWHPLYDSIRFEVNKEYVRTQKKVEIYFQARRRSTREQPAVYQGDSTVLLLVDIMSWSSWIVEPHEFTDNVYTYAVSPGDVFGPTSAWNYPDCLPFRFVRELPDGSAWVQFAQQFGLMTEGMRSNTNFVFLSDSAIHLGTKSLDAGATVTLSLQPDYAPRGTIEQDWAPTQRERHVPKRQNQADSCDVIEAQVERTHIKNILALLKGDYAEFALACSGSYKPRDNRLGLPLEEFFRKTAGRDFPGKLADKRLLELFRLRGEEMYVNGLCDRPANERFLKECRERGFEPQRGDVYIYWPGAAWSGGMSAVYRKESGEWKIVAMF